MTYYVFEALEKAALSLSFPTKFIDQKCITWEKLRLKKGNDKEQKQINRRA